MKGLKNFLPLLLLAVATRAIPLPEPRSIAMVSAHAAVERSAEAASFDKRDVRGDLDTTEAEMTEPTTEMADEGEMAPADGVDAGAEEPEEASDSDGVATTEGVEVVNDGADAEEEVHEEEEEEKAEEEEEMKEQEEETKAEDEEMKMEEAETEKPEEKMEEKKGEEEKIDGRIGEEEKHENGEGVMQGGEEEGVKPVLPEEGPIFAFGHPIQGPFPWPLGPLPLDHPDDLPDHEVQQVGNEVYSPGKVIFPIYLIRIDHRYLQESPYQGL